jgi:hypothetical protein
VKERRSELKVVWAVVAVLSANLLGIDADMLMDIATDPSINSGVDDIVIRASKLTNSHEKMTVSTMLAAIAGIYTAGRSVKKSIDKWVEGKDVATTEEG